MADWELLWGGNFSFLWIWIWTMLTRSCWGLPWIAWGINYGSRMDFETERCHVGIMRAQRKRTSLIMILVMFHKENETLAYSRISNKSWPCEEGRTGILERGKIMGRRTEERKTWNMKKNLSRPEAWVWNLAELLVCCVTLSKCLPRSRSQTLRLPNERVVLEPLAFEIPSTLSERKELRYPILLAIQ